MLNIFNDLEPFFMDNYRRINVREYSRLKGISAPTSSKILQNLVREGLLKQEEERNYIFYSAQRESPLFINLSRVFWLNELEKSGLNGFLEKEFSDPLIILFGSFSKAEVRKDSDIDIAIFSASGKNPNLSVFEKKLKRKIHLFAFKNADDVKSPELLANLHNGFILMGRW